MISEKFLLRFFNVIFFLHAGKEEATLKKALSVRIIALPEILTINLFFSQRLMDTAEKPTQKATRDGGKESL